MKPIKNISLIFVFLLIGYAAFAQKQCSLRLTDQSPSIGQYTANVYVIYDGSIESYQLNVNVILDATTDIPFDILNDVGDDVYRIVIFIQEPGSPLPPLAGPYSSSLFNTNFWTYNNVNVTADLP